MKKPCEKRGGGNKFRASNNCHQGVGGEQSERDGGGGGRVTKQGANNNPPGIGGVAVDR